MLSYLTLIPYNKTAQQIPLHPQDNDYTALDYIIQSKATVFSNLTYSAILSVSIPETIQSLDFFVNGIRIDIDLKENGNINFNDGIYGTRIFSDCYGFVQISIQITTKTDEITLVSDYLSVMVRKGLQNDSVRRMAEYIYANNEHFLYGDNIRSRDISGLKESEYRSLESRIAVLGQIYLQYEENYRYFKTNARFKTEARDCVDSFEKLQYITNSTICYIAQHPEQLNRVNYNTGIKYNNQHYQPKRTLISRNIYTYDIYENQVVVGFLRTAINDIADMLAKVSDTIKSVPDDPGEVDGYVSSSFFIYSSTKKILRDYAHQLNALSSKYIILFNAYKGALCVTETTVVDIPKPTAVFLSVPHYHKIFDSIVSWFKHGIINLQKEQFMLSFLKISDLYECYVLSKFYQHILDCRFSLVSSDRFHYIFSGRTQYRNTNCLNTFVFKRGEQLVTVYYQPVIYADSRKATNGINLYRNTSIPFPKDNESNSHGTYYTPDYIIKIDNGTTENYVLADAKFSTLGTVKRHQVPALAFKYLFSVTPINEEDKILGLCIINGQSDSEMDLLEDVYDRTPSPGSITPSAEILTLTENREENRMEHAELLGRVLDKYLCK